MSFNVVFYDGTPSRAGKVIAATKLKERVWVVVPDHTKTLLPYRLEDVDGIMGSFSAVDGAWEWNFSIGGEEQERHCITEEEGILSLFEWAMSINRDMPEEVMSSHGISCCKNAPFLSLFCDSPRSCADCSSFLQVCESNGFCLGVECSF
jgi:hypothetical protein